MTPSLRSPTFLLFRLRSRALRRLPSIRQSALQYFSLNHPRNVRLQTRHVLRTFLSVVSNASSLPVEGLSLPCLRCTGIKSGRIYTARCIGPRDCPCLVFSRP